MKKTACAIFAAVLIAGCTTKQIQIVPNAPNAEVTTLGENGKIERRGDQFFLKAGQSKNPVKIRVTAPDYESEEREIIPGKATRIKVDLAKLLQRERFSFRSNPEGARVTINGTYLGTTPFSAEISFSRTTSQDNWPVENLLFSLEDWQSQTLEVDLTSPNTLRTIELKRLRNQIPVRLIAQTKDGDQLSASVYAGGELIGTTPLTYTFDFQRADGSAPWPTFNIEVRIQDQYKTVEFIQEIDSPTKAILTLEPVSELSVARAFPIVKMTPTGAQMDWDNSRHPGAIETGESLSTVRDLRALTDFDRNNPKEPCVNSFTIMPDGQDLIFGLTVKHEIGRISNLWQSSAQSLASGRRQITEGPYLDTNPAIGISTDSESIVFQSNRGFRDSIDISSLRVVNGQVLGGIRQLTRETRFNYHPVYTNEDWELFFVSLEERFALAKPQISFMGLDGSLPTYLSENGENLAMSPDGRTVYFCRNEPATDKIQIYSIPKEGRPLTQVITKSAFMSANCTSPAISSDGRHLLFVSDIDQDENGRNNNNIYLLNITTGNITPITQNLSDDIYPKWSPTEPNVLFFLSNRGGCYNVWRLELTNLN